MRVTPIPESTAPWLLRPFFWNQRRKYGRVLDAARVWARTPRLFLGVALLYGVIDRRRSPIDPALRSLVTVRVSQINACAFCVDVNTATLKIRGVAPEKIAALADWRESALFDNRERAALDFAEAMTRSDARVEDRHVTALRGHWDENGIVELAGLIGFQNMSSKFNNAFDIPAQGFCTLPQASGALASGEEASACDRSALFASADRGSGAEPTRNRWPSGNSLHDCSPVETESSPARDIREEK